MANIILKNVSGAPQEYSGVTKIKLPTVEGGTAEFSEGSGGIVIKTDGDWQGTAIPETGYISKIYFNTEASAEEVTAKLYDIIVASGTEGLNVEAPFVMNEDFNHYIALSATPNLEDLGIYKPLVMVVAVNEIAGSEMFLPIFIDVVDGTVQDRDILRTMLVNEGLGDFVGWNPQFNGVYEFNDNMSPNISAVLEEFYELWKEMLQSMCPYISTTPFTRAEGAEITLSGEYDGSTLVVSKIPEGEIVGTTVPGSGPLKTVYFNTSMSIEETNEIIKSLSYVVTDVMPWNAAVVAADSTLTTGLLVHYYPGPDAETQGHYEIQAVTPEGFKDIYVWNNVPAEEGEGQEGWKGIESLELNIDDNVLDAMGPSLGYTNQNEAVSKLISSTPFKLVGKGIIDLKPVIENKQIPLEIKVNNTVVTGGNGTLTIHNGWRGVPVPNNGSTVNTIYFNKQLSKDEVINILTDITYTPLSTDTSVNYVFCNWTQDTGSEGGIEGYVAVVCTLPNKYEIYVNDIVAFDSETDGWASWVFDTPSYTFGLASKDAYSYFPVGADNDKLSSLISSSSFINNGSNIIKLNGAYKGRELTITENNTEINVWDKSNPLNNKEIVTSVNVKIPESPEPLWYISLTTLVSNASTYKYKFKGIYTANYGEGPEKAVYNEEITKTLKWHRLIVNQNATSIMDKYRAVLVDYNPESDMEREFILKNIDLECASCVDNSTVDSEGNKTPDVWYLCMGLDTFNLLNGMSVLYFMFEGTTLDAPTFPVFISVPSFGQTDILSLSTASTRVSNALGSVILSTDYLPGTFSIKVADSW